MSFLTFNQFINENKNSKIKYLFYDKVKSGFFKNLIKHLNLSKDNYEIDKIEAISENGTKFLFSVFIIKTNFNNIMGKLLNTKYSPLNVWEGNLSPNFNKIEGWELHNNNKVLFIINGNEIYF